MAVGPRGFPYWLCLGKEGLISAHILLYFCVARFRASGLKLQQGRLSGRQVVNRPKGAGQYSRPQLARYQACRETTETSLSTVPGREASHEYRIGQVFGQCRMRRVGTNKQVPSSHRNQTQAGYPQQHLRHLWHFGQNGGFRGHGLLRASTHARNHAIVWLPGWPHSPEGILTGHFDIVITNMSRCSQEVGTVRSVAKERTQR